MPEPHDGEKRASFIARFMSSKAMKDEYVDHTQRVAVAYRQWRDAGNRAPRKKTLARYA
jgi:hypothetical protein